MSSLERGPASEAPWELVAGVRMLIPRPDLGANCSTLIAAGGRIPRDLLRYMPLGMRKVVVYPDNDLPPDLETILPAWRPVPVVVYYPAR
jgi:hypothetical protein